MNKTCGFKQGSQACRTEQCMQWLPEYNDCSINVQAKAADKMANAICAGINDLIDKGEGSE